MFSFNHFNFNVFDLERSLKFYDEALGLKPVREKNAADGSFKLVYLGDGVTDFTLELTWLRDRDTPYDLGEQNSTSPLSPTIWKKPMKSTPRSAAYVMKIPAWAYTSSKIQTATG